MLRTCNGGTDPQTPEEVATWCIAYRDEFGPMICFVAEDAEWVWGDNTPQARVFTDAEKQALDFPCGGEWEAIA